MKTICLFVDVPLCSFRPNWSREYQDTFPFPPPSTIFGMLLSLTGEDWDKKEDFKGVKLALAIEEGVENSRIFRKFRRVPQSNKEADPLTSRRPDYQELLLWLKLWLWLNDGGSNNSLVERVQVALNRNTRKTINRYGGLSLGESSHLVNEVKICEPDNKIGSFLVHTVKGFYSLPVWVHHERCGVGKTRMERFEILNPELLSTPDENDDKWITIMC